MKPSETESRDVPSGGRAAGIAVVALLLASLSPAVHLAQQAHGDESGRAAVVPAVDPVSAVAAAARSPGLQGFRDLRAVGDDLARVEDHPDAGFAEIVVGPFYLISGMPHMRAPVQIVSLPVDGWLHGFSWEMVDEEGEPLPDAFLHHVNLIDPDHRQLFSPIARRLVAAGRETKGASIPEMVGVPLRAPVRLLVVSMLANMSGEDHPRAYLRVRLTYTRRAERAVPPMAVFPFYLDVMGPVGIKDFEVPPGRTEQAWAGAPAADARLLGLGGHLHDYAVELRLEDAETGEVLWRVEPVKEGPYRVLSVPTTREWWRGGVKVERGHPYRVVAVYDNPTDGPAPLGGMGVVAGAARVSPENWPELDPSDPDYLEDLHGTVTAPLRNAGHAGHGGRDGDGGFHGSHSH